MIITCWKDKSARLKMNVITCNPPGANLLPLPHQLFLFTKTKHIFNFWKKTNAYCTFVNRPVEYTILMCTD